MRSLVGIVSPRCWNRLAIETKKEKENSLLSFLGSGLLDATEESVFRAPSYDRNDFAAWDANYKELAGFPSRHWAGSAGVDAALIAYQSLLVAETDKAKGFRDMYETLCLRSMVHAGDNDSTGTMAGAWFGALYGWEGVPENHFAELEYKDRMTAAGRELRALVAD